VAVGGLTLVAANRSVVERIGKMYPTLEAYCTLYDLRKIRVGISGAIYKSGYYLTTPVSRVSDLITLAGAPLISAALDKVVIERLDGEHINCDLTRFYHEGDISQNPVLRGGDRVILPFMQPGANGNTGMRQVIVIGEIKKPGAFIYQPGLKVIDYIAMAGGPTTFSSLASIKVLRADGQEATGPQAEIQAGDIVHVQRSLRYILVGNTGYMQGVLVGLNMYLAYLATKR
ncbi:MAG: SLBB domain-containing protein, partial [Candidatus Marinimicrobia bacterium]|nr:SLBB domain-containing protein [Candidatus Neomarinimicrobiota bacterium]